MSSKKAAPPMSRCARATKTSNCGSPWPATCVNGLYPLVHALKQLLNCCSAITFNPNNTWLFRLKIINCCHRMGVCASAARQARISPGESQCVPKSLRRFWGCLPLIISYSQKLDHCYLILRCHPRRSSAPGTSSSR